MKLPILTISFFIILIGGFLLLGFEHELVHQTIYSSYGIESRIGLDWEYLGLATYPDMTEYQNCNETCNMLHNENEIVGYHLSSFYLMIGIGLLFLIGMIETYLEEKAE